MKRYLVFLMCLPGLAWAQPSDLVQRITAFQSDLAETYKVKTLNVGGESLGALESETPEYRTDFKLEGKEKTWTTSSAMCASMFLSTFFTLPIPMSSIGR